MNRLVTRFQSPIARILAFDHHPPNGHSDGDAEVSTSYSLNFVERGSFAISDGRREIKFCAGDALISYPGAVRNFWHFHEIADDVCLSVEFAAGVAEEAVEAAVVEGSCPRLPSSSRIAFLRWRLRDALSTSDRFATESAAVAALQALQPVAAQTPGNLYLKRGFSVHARRVSEAIELLETEFDQTLSLAKLCRLAAMSPYYFTRVFHELVGISPHQFLLKVRLDNAAKLLSEGAGVTMAAFDSGFENLSHFIRLFRKRFGVTPGRFA